jgi:hypothetical protein
MNPKSLQKTIMLGAGNRDDHATPNPLEDYPVSIVKIGAPNPSLLKMQNRVDGGWFVAILGDVRITFGSRHPGSPSARLLCAKPGHTVVWSQLD